MAWRVTMAETLKKIIECEYKCFLCDTLTQSSAGRVRLFGKSAVELPHLIKTAIWENISKHRNSEVLKYQQTSQNLRQIS